MTRPLHLGTAALVGLLLAACGQLDAVGNAPDQQAAAPSEQPRGGPVASPAPIRAQAYPDDVILYEHAYWQGRSQAFSLGYAAAAWGNFTSLPDNSASSLYVPIWKKVVVCDEIGSDSCWTFYGGPNGTWYSYIGDGQNDRVSYLKVSWQ